MPAPAARSSLEGQGSSAAGASSTASGAGISAASGAGNCNGASSAASGAGCYDEMRGQDQEKNFWESFPSRSALVQRNHQPRPGKDLQKPWNTYHTLDENKKVRHEWLLVPLLLPGTPPPIPEPFGGKAVPESARVFTTGSSCTLLEELIGEPIFQSFSPKRPAVIVSLPSESFGIFVIVDNLRHGHGRRQISDVYSGITSSCVQVSLTLRRKGFQPYTRFGPADAAPLHEHPEDTLLGGEAPIGF